MISVWRERRENVKWTVKNKELEDRDVIFFPLKPFCHKYILEFSLANVPFKGNKSLHVKYLTLLRMFCYPKHNQLMYIQLKLLFFKNNTVCLCNCVDNSDEMYPVQSNNHFCTCELIKQTPNNTPGKRRCLSHETLRSRVVDIKNPFYSFE